MTLGGEAKRSYQREYMRRRRLEAKEKAAKSEAVALPDLPVLDPRTLTEGQMDHCRAIFDDLKDREFLLANEAWRDETRKAERAVLEGATIESRRNERLPYSYFLTRPFYTPS